MRAIVDSIDPMTHLLKRYRSSILFDWRNIDGLTPAIGPVINCVRATNTTSLRADGSYDFVPWNAIGADHYVGGAYTDIVIYRTQPASWASNKMNPTPVDTGVQSILPAGKNLIRWTANGANSNHWISYIGFGAATAGDIYTGKLILKDFNQRYIVICSYGYTTAEQFKLEIDLTLGTVTPSSTGAHPNTFAGSIKLNSDGSYLVEYTFTVPTTETIDKPLVLFTDSAWNYNSTAAGSCDFAAFTVVKSPFQVPIIYPVSETNATYAGAATNLSRTIITTAGKHLILGAVVKANHAPTSEAANALPRVISCHDLAHDLTTYRRIIFDQANNSVSGDNNIGASATINASAWRTAAAANKPIAYIYSGSRLVAYDGTTFWNAGDDTGNAQANANINNLSIGSRNNNGTFSQQVNAGVKNALVLEMPNIPTLAELQSLAANLLRISQ